MHALCRNLASMLLISTIIMMPDASSLCMDGKQMIQRNFLPLPKVNSSLSVQMGTKATLCCPTIPLTRVLIITWEISLRDSPVCKLAYNKEANESKESNCTDGRITWASRPDRSPHLRIDEVAATHEGYYRCEVVTTDGNFVHGYHLQVLAPPEVSLFPGKNRTAVCEAAAGKPAARIFWNPEGECVTEERWHSNGTVTVRSTCPSSESGVSTVTCLVSHPTGNKSLSIELLPGLGTPVSPLLVILYVKLSLLVVILVTVGFAFFQRTKDRSSPCEHARPVLLEDEKHTEQS